MYYSEVVEKITHQQKGKEGTPAWMVGEQLKDICNGNETASEIVAKDLDMPAMSLENAAAQIKKYADNHKTGNFSCVTPVQAEKILCDFYGIGNLGDVISSTEYADFESFLG